MSTSIEVLPWPNYSDTGRGPVWGVRIVSHRFRGTLMWSARLRRFSFGHETFRLRSLDTAAYNLAVRTMVDFCAKGQKQPEVAWHPV